MKNQSSGVIQRVFVIAGVCLLGIAMVALILWRWGIGTSEQQVTYYVNAIRASIPEPQGAALEERRDNTMPVLSLEGRDFVGILEIPRYGSALPVCDDWGETWKYPCRFHGSIYDRTMQIGGTSQKGQYDFYREISVGDTIFFTDMEGNRYTYTVKDLRYEKKADQSVLLGQEAALVLFIKNVYAFEYIFVFCDGMG